MTAVTPGQADGLFRWEGTMAEFDRQPGRHHRIRNPPEREGTPDG